MTDLKNGRLGYPWLSGGTTPTITLAMTFFEALYGYKPMQFPVGVLFDSTVPAASTLTKGR